MTSLKTSIKTITYLSDIGCLEIQGASLKRKTTAYYRLHISKMARLGIFDAHDSNDASAYMEFEWHILRFMSVV